MIASRTRRALLLAAPVFYFAAIRPRLLGWGASRQERHQPLPGDDLIPARWQTTRGITISAPAEEIWPWLVQIGYGRGGWYSYDRLERRVGAGDFVEGGSAKRIIPELQRLALTPVDETSCRLLVRVRAHYRPSWLRPLMPLLLEPIHFLMERKMLHTIEQRARRRQ